MNTQCMCVDMGSKRKSTGNLAEKLDIFSAVDNKWLVGRIINDRSQFGYKNNDVDYIWAENPTKLLIKAEFDLISFLLYFLQLLQNKLDS